MIKETEIVFKQYLEMIGNPLKISDRFRMAIFNTGHRTEANVRCLKEAFIFEARLDEEQNDRFNHR